MRTELVGVSAALSTVVLILVVGSWRDPPQMTLMREHPPASAIPDPDCARLVARALAEPLCGSSDYPAIRAALSALVRACPSASPREVGTAMARAMRDACGAAP